MWGLRTWSLSPPPPPHTLTSTQNKWLFMDRHGYHTFLISTEPNVVRSQNLGFHVYQHSTGQPAAAKWPQMWNRRNGTHLIQIHYSDVSLEEKPSQFLEILLWLKPHYNWGMYRPPMRNINHLPEIIFAVPLKIPPILLEDKSPDSLQEIFQDQFSWVVAISSDFCLGVTTVPSFQAKQFTVLKIDIAHLFFSGYEFHKGSH